MLTHWLYNRTSAWRCKQDTAKIYAQTFSSGEITRDSLHMLDCKMVKELGIKIMGVVLAILKLTKEPSVPPASYIRPSTAKLPQLNSEMTSQQFKKSGIDWDIFTKMTNLPTALTNIQLFNCASEAIQNSIINTYPELFNTSSEKLLDMLKVLVTQKSNVMVHRISFSLIVQSDNGSIQNYLVWLQSGAENCDFICPNCNHDLSNVYIKDQFIQGIANDALQADKLAKARSLKTLEQNIRHAEAFEMTMRDQDKISSALDIAGFQMSAYHQQKQAQNVVQLTATNKHERTMMRTKPCQNECWGFSSKQHGGVGSGDRSRMCPV